MKHFSGDEIIAEINVTPLVDIMLVLLIIFMLVSSVVDNFGIKVELPTAASGKSLKVRTFSVVISKDGKIFLSGKEMQNMKEVLARLEKVRAEDVKVQVVISADRDVRHGKVVDVMDALRLAGFTDFAINVLPEE